MIFFRRFRERLAADRRDAQRYRWLRVHPTFETANFLARITPGQFDMAVDFYMGADPRWRITAWPDLPTDCTQEPK